MGKEKEIPKWVQDEIKDAKFGKPESITRTGYILEIYDKDMKIDSQLYEAIEDGRKIIEGMNLPKKIKPADLMKGVVYEFTINSLKAPLSKKVIEYLKKEMEIDMDAIYQFELTNLELMDVDSDSAAEEESEE
ncbi:conserved hypothetical protein [Nitrosotalea sinensis]|jgi:hypothetical protein|uniref:Uncharacterized protein n=1 Tax=Nitrosotalea sinensis TaxID=1499975 RepID=A0A2H1EFL3_9ARCH|nr:hypothetical protein [Candidatus Nitrosotalea sinensis]SHO43363.1 conserved hypothetical protein [Candidatus Nitrosotalea sinensis]